MFLRCGPTATEGHSTDSHGECAAAGERATFFCRISREIYFAPFSSTQKKQKATTRKRDHPPTKPPPSFLLLSCY